MSASRCCQVEAEPVCTNSIVTVSDQRLLYYELNTTQLDALSPVETEGVIQNTIDRRMVNAGVGAEEEELIPKLVLLRTYYTHQHLGYDPSVTKKLSQQGNKQSIRKFLQLTVWLM